MQWMTHIVRKTTNKLNRNDNTTYQTREHWKLLNSNENTNQSCTRPSGSCRIGLYFHSRSTISNTHSFGMRYYTIIMVALRASKKCDVPKKNELPRGTLRLTCRSTEPQTVLPEGLNF